MALLSRLVLLVVAVALSSNAQGQDFVDNFNDGDDAGWTRVDPIGDLTGGALASDFSFPGGDSYRIQAVASPNPGLIGPGRAGAARLDITQSDFEVTVDVTDWDDALDQGFGLVARVDNIGPGTTSGYLLSYVNFATDPTQSILHISVIVNEDLENPESAATSDSDTVEVMLDSSKDYRMVFTGVGTQLEGKIFEINDLVNPLASVSAIDTAYASGSPGVISAVVSPEGNFFPTDVTFDSFSTTAIIPEPGSLLLLSCGGALFLCRRSR